MKKLMFLITALLAVGTACFAGCSVKQAEPEKSEKSYELVQNAEDAENTETNDDTDGAEKKHRRGDRCPDGDRCPEDDAVPDFREAHRNRGYFDGTDENVGRQNDDGMPHRRRPPAPNPKPMPEKERN